MGEYKYDDEGGQFLTFTLTVLLAFIVPMTYQTLLKRHRYPSQGWLDQRGHKAKDVLPLTRPSAVWFVGRLVLIALGWACVALLVRAIANSAANSTHKIYDPFSILGIDTSASEKDIKRRYRKLSLQFHPDKVSHADNQTKEEVETHYIELTKAYKALTDETTRLNFERYGHPDGRQEMSLGIALPTWVIESQNNVWVLGMYGLVFGVGLPLLVARWWYGSRSRTKDGVLNATALSYFKELRATTKASEIPRLLASSDEMRAIVRKLSGADAAVFDELERSLKERHETVYHAEMDMPHDTPEEVRRGMLLLGAYLYRLDMPTAQLTRAKYEAGHISERLLHSLLSMSAAHLRLAQSQMIIDMIPRVVQAVPLLPEDTGELLQLPHMTLSLAQELLAKQPSVRQGLQALWKVPDSQRRSVLLGEGRMTEAQYAECIRTLGEWPRLELVDAYFTVAGEQGASTGSITLLVVKTRLLPLRRDGSLLVDGRRRDAKPLTTGDSNVRPSTAEDEEEAQPGASDYAAKMGMETIGVAYAPYFAEERKPEWFVELGDDKSDRIIVPPSKFTDVGQTSTRVFKINLQAPPEPGMFSFRLKVQSDSFLGSSASVPMTLRVDKAPDSDEEEEDEISDPEEDTIAGQMALMRGERVKRVMESDEDEDEEDEDEEDEDEDEEDEDEEEDEEED